MTDTPAQNPSRTSSMAGLEYASTRAALFSSSTSSRIASLRAIDDRIKSSTLDVPGIAALLRLLFDTHSFYTDRPSRRAVQTCLDSVIATIGEPKLLAPFVSAIRQEAQKPTIAPSNAFVLVEWCALLLQKFVNTAFWDTFATDVIAANAAALETCVQPSARPSVGHSALVAARRGLRAAFSHDDSREKNIQDTVQMLTEKRAQPSAKNTVLLGVVAGVCSRHPQGRVILQTQKPHYYTFVARELVGSRTPVPRHLAMALRDFITEFATLQDLEKDVVPPIEKGLLRAPEVVLDFLAHLLGLFPKDDHYDLSHILDKNLLKPLLSNVKSSNPAVRDGVLAAFRAAATRSKDTEARQHVVEEVLGPLKSGKLASADQRALHANMLHAVSFSSTDANKVALGLAGVAAKEGNEAALGAELLPLGQAVARLIQHRADVPKPVVDVFVKGMSDKKISTRRLWVIQCGELLFSVGGTGNDGNDGNPWPENAAKFVEAVATPMMDGWTEIIKSPAAAVQSGLITVAYVFAALMGQVLSRSPSAALQTKLKKINLTQECLSLDPKTAILLNHRVYSRLLADDDCRWFLRSLQAVFPHISASAEPVQTAWSQAFVYLVSTPSLSPGIRKSACEAITEFYVQDPVTVSSAVVGGLWQWVEASDRKDKDSIAAGARFEVSCLHLVLHAVVPGNEAFEKIGVQRNQALVERQMCAMLVLARKELVPRCSWIDLCLKVDVDPGTLARQYEHELIEQLVERTQYGQNSANIREAACSAAADLAFVAPEVMIPRVIDIVRADLSAAEIGEVGPVEAAIFRTPEGTVFVDVLAKKSQSLPNKNTKDYDTLKWEEELRSQLAQKKGLQKKLTPDEQAKVNAQLKKEAEIRQRIQRLEARLMRGLGIIQSLVSGPPTDASLWLGPSVHVLLAAMEAGACQIVGRAAPTAYLACSEKVAARLGAVRPFIGVATLRAVDITSLPDNMMEENLEELLTRVLYRLRFAGEQRPFDPVSVTYMLPLIFAILQRGGVGQAADDRDTQLVLAIEFLSFHALVCSDEHLPRAELLSILISSLQRYSQHHKLVKDCFADVVRSIAPNIKPEEIRVLCKGVTVQQANVRETVLQAINAEIDLSDLQFSEELWIACHDDVAENRELAREIWDESGFQVPEEAAVRLLPYLESGDAQLRRAAARALGDTCKAFPSAVQDTLVRLRASYAEFAKPRVPQLDEFGMPKKVDLSDQWEPRHGIATAFKQLATCLEKTQIDSFLGFLIDSGPLGDQNAMVRGEMLDAALVAVDLHGKALVDKLMKTFERTLSEPDKGSAAADRVNEAVIIMYGALARHLKPGDAKIPGVLERLMATLSTPSETVQYAVAECLPPLVRTCGNNSSKYFEQMLEILLASKNYAAKRGAAYGLAGLILGRGISVLREYRILISLKSAAENKKEPHQREGAFIAFELLPTFLGRLFEPYVIQIVPQLLTGFGDSSADVREACLAAAKACFAKLSSYGVKQILPTLLNGLDDDQWRSKRGACELLGAMAYLDPKQLAQSLPDIIPPLTGVLNDTHKEVRAAGNKSLKRFGEVIENPEVKSLVDILLKALSDPTKYTDEALDSLIKVQFVHYLDAPSLALVTRILQRGLGDRSNTKRKASQVIGSLAHLTERKDLISHLPVLVSGLKVAAVDPVPTTRATASRALGSLVEKLGEDALPDLIPSLMQTLKSDTGAGDRLGSAQALSEVLAGLGTSRLEEIMPTILQNVESPKAVVREGFMSLFVFLPVCFGNSFANYLGKIIPPILTGLTDEIESIRDTALRAGRLLVKNFAARAVDLLLPELERGLADDNYRIRLSSVELVGDLLFNLTGITGNADAEDEEEKAKEAGASLREILGDDKRNKVLSALYICRCDTAAAVRSAAIGVWKALVASPRILRELTPTLTQLIIRRLGSPSMEHKVIASNALGELIRRAGDGVLSTLLPTLEEGLQTSTGTDAKQGICLALKELISSASDEALEDHEKTLISVVRTALTDFDEGVREAAAEAFDSLQQILGKRAVDQVLPYLLNLLRSEEDADNALSALLTLLTEATRSNIILPNLIPTLTTSPISAFNAKALASLSRVAGSAMTRRLPNIINSLMDNIVDATDEELRAELEDALDTVIQSVDEYDGLNTVMNVLLQLARNDDHRKRAITASRLANFFAHSDVDYSRYNQDIIRALLVSFDDRDREVVKAAWTALSEFTKKLKKEEMEALVPSTRQSLQQVGVPGANLPGFELPKGINAILPIFLQGLMNGTPDQRTSAALAISDIVDRTSENSLKPFVTQITGPLIRAVSERSTEVRSAILLTLNNLLEKMPTALKPFLPQLQRTFARSLADTTSELLRSRAAKALGTLIKFTPRVDPLIAELVTGSKTSDSGVRAAMLKALYEVVSKAGANMGEGSRAAVLGLIDTETETRDTAMAVTYAKLLGALVKNVPGEVANGLIRNRVAPVHFTSSSVLALNAVLVVSPQMLLESPAGEDLPELLCQGMSNKNLFVADNTILATGKYLLSDSHKSFEATKPIFSALSAVIGPGNPSDSRRLALVVLRTVSRANMELVRPHLALLAPPTFASVRDPVIPVKLAAEATFVQLFGVVDEEAAVFDRYMSGPGGELPANTKRSMQDYFKRVALRLGQQARERREAEGGQGGLGLSHDEVEDEKEVWSVGAVDVDDGIFSQE
ncbi:ARM repeat-containing protein [Xylariaceae sp. FL0594]|nr:ARM repeat-containing protein [Xylariaceae sp. FL0594]